MVLTNEQQDFLRQRAEHYTAGVLQDIDEWDDCVQFDNQAILVYLFGDRDEIKTRLQQFRSEVPAVTSFYFRGHLEQQEADLLLRVDEDDLANCIFTIFASLPPLGDRRSLHIYLSNDLVARNAVEVLKRANDWERVYISFEIPRNRTSNLDTFFQAIKSLTSIDSMSLNLREIEGAHNMDDFARLVESAFSTHVSYLMIDGRALEETRTIALSREGYELLKGVRGPKMLRFTNLIVGNEWMSLLLSMQISQLHLDYCRIEGCGAAVGEALVTNSCLTKLGLDFCTIDAMSATQIAAGIARNKAIRIIWCGVSDRSQVDAYSQILRSLLEMGSLEEFYFQIRCEWTLMLLESFYFALGIVGFKAVSVPCARRVSLTDCTPWLSALFLHTNIGLTQLHWHGVVDDDAFRLISWALSRNTEVDFFSSSNEHSMSKLEQRKG